MGATTSQPVTAAQYSGSTFSLSAHYGGKVRVVFAPDLRSELCAVVVENGTKAMTMCTALHQVALMLGNKPERVPTNYFGSTEFPLGRQAFWHYGRDGIKGRKIVGAFLALIRTCGFRLEAGGMTVQRKSYNLSSFAFSTRYPKYDFPGNTEEWICVMPTGRDKLHIFGVCRTVAENTHVKIIPWHLSQDELGPIRGALDRAISRTWGKFKNESCSESFKYKLSGYIFSANGKDTVKTRLAFAAILDELASIGFALHCSADLSTRDSDVSSMFFRRGRTAARPGPRAAISLNKQSRLRVYGPDRLKRIIQTQLSAVGVLKSTEDYAGAMNLRLNFWAWSCHGEATVRAREVLMGVIEAAGRAGYDLDATLDLSTKMTDKSSFFFVPNISQPHYPAAFISLHSTDKIRVLGPPELVSHVRNAIMHGWIKGIQREKMYGNAHEFKLRSMPWVASSGLSVHTRVLISNIVAAIVNTGWEVAASADLSEKTTGGDNPTPLDLDTLFLRSGISVGAAVLASSSSAAAPPIIVAAEAMTSTSTQVAVPIAAPVVTNAYQNPAQHYPAPSAPLFKIE